MPEFQLDTDGEVLNMTFADLAPQTQGYIEAMFFTNQSCIAMVDYWSDESQELIREGQADGDLPNDAGFGDIHPDTLADIQSDLIAFERACGDLYREAVERPGYDRAAFGRDFWFTRNGHGVGYWDRRPLEADGLGDKLADLAREAGGRDAWFIEGEDSPTGYGWVILD